MLQSKNRQERIQVPYDKDGPMGDIGQEMPQDPLEALRELSRKCIFVHDPMFHAPMHPRGASGRLRITSPFWGGAAMMLDTTAELEIGQWCYFDDFVYIYTHIHEYGVNARFYEPKPMPKKIGAYVYLAPRVTITGLCTEIGEGARVTEGSVVRNDIEPYSVYAGNPAVRIGAMSISDEWKALLKEFFAEARASPEPGVSDQGSAHVAPGREASDGSPPPQRASPPATDLGELYKEMRRKRTEELEREE